MESNNAVLGIDPGFDGGFAIISEDGWLEIEPMPMFVVDKKKTRKIKAKEDNPNNQKTKSYDAKVKMLDYPEIAEYMRRVKPRIRKAFLERVNARPGEGVAGMFRFGEAYAAVKMAVVAAGIPFEEVMPQTWTKTMHAGIPKTIGNKDKSKISVQQIFPDMSFVMGRDRTPHLGCVDAALIAKFGLDRDMCGNGGDR